MFRIWGRRFLLGTVVSMKSVTMVKKKRRLLLVRVGFSPANVGASAIRFSSQVVGMANDLGTIEPSKAEDLVALDEDPTREISAVSRVKAVSQGANRIV
ncbi:MAG: hypothetical protein VYA69_11280 [Gemmatimonadota bacterium]|nr:hypothetical protein [Gemmatimonadota bacterium]